MNYRQDHVLVAGIYFTSGLLLSAALNPLGGRRKELLMWPEIWTFHTINAIITYAE